MNLLSVAGLCVQYGGIQAVKGIDLAVNAGELVCLIGANGAGKTTTLKALVGLLPSRAGRICWQEEDITGHPTHTLVHKGMVLVPEGRGIFPQMSVEENLLMGAYARPRQAMAGNDLEQVYGRFPRLFERRRQAGGTLSGGEQQMLAIGRALMSHPKLLLLDEPSMGLAPMLVNRIFATVREIAAAGTTVFLVEQNARQALQIADRGYVMEAGRITLSGTAPALLANPQVQRAYLGEP